MPSSGRATKKSTPARNTVTSAKQWKQRAANRDELKLPSGNVCRVKRPGVPSLIAGGFFPDTLTPIAQQAVDDGKRGKKHSQEELQDQFRQFLASPKDIAMMFEMTDRITAHCVVEPACEYHMTRETEEDPWEEIPEEDRDPEVLYTDEVDFEDKLFIFQYVVGGSRDLQSFREQLATSMDGIS